MLRIYIHKISSILLAALTFPLLVFCGMTAKASDYSHPGYITGYSDGTFRPDELLTRAEAAQIFYNLALNQTDVGRPAVIEEYPDVAEDKWYSIAIANLGGWKIITGYPDGTFRPEEDISRAEFVTIAVRFTGISSSGRRFIHDVPANHWAFGYIAAAMDKGIVAAYSDGSFGPENKVTRAEAVTMVNRILDCDGIKDGNSFSDVPRSYWAYEAITAATTGHEH